jgi:hypothetical protein
MAELLTQNELDALLDIDYNSLCEKITQPKIIRKSFIVSEDFEYTINDTINNIISDLGISPDNVISINEIKRNDVYEITFYYKGF